MRISFIGDIMLGRFVKEKYDKQVYELLNVEVKDALGKSDYVVGNLESPITEEKAENILAFAGDCNLLKEVKIVDLFSLSNNHINDFGEKGIGDTIRNLERNEFSSNGIFIEEYRPFEIEKENCKVAIVTCTDTLNYKLDSKCKYKILRVDSPDVNRIIKEYKEKGFFVILFAHCGNLFSRFPNPLIREFLYTAIDSGAGCVVTCHSHCLGGADSYKGVPIFYSLGDFLMDGGSYRRRRSCILSLYISDNHIKEWNIIPTVTNRNLQTVIADGKEAKKIMHDFDKVSRKMQKKRKSYEVFFKYQYKKEMLIHSLSTLHFLYDSKGFIGFLKMLKVRYYAVYRMMHKMIFDRSKRRNDGDGLDLDLKHILKIDDIR